MINQFGEVRDHQSLALCLCWASFLSVSNILPELYKNSHATNHLCILSKWERAVSFECFRSDVFLCGYKCSQSILERIGAKYRKDPGPQRGTQTNVLLSACVWQGGHASVRGKELQEGGSCTWPNSCENSWTHEGGISGVRLGGSRPWSLALVSSLVMLVWMRGTGWVYNK